MKITVFTTKEKSLILLAVVIISNSRAISGQGWLLAAAGSDDLLTEGEPWAALTAWVYMLASCSEPHRVYNIPSTGTNKELQFACKILNLNITGSSAISSIFQLSSIIFPIISYPFPLETVCANQQAYTQPLGPRSNLNHIWRKSRALSMVWRKMAFGWKRGTQGREVAASAAPLLFQHIHASLVYTCFVFILLMLLLSCSIPMRAPSGVLLSPTTVISLFLAPE